jgi:hypothetical protein
MMRDFQAEKSLGEVMGKHWGKFQENVKTKAKSLWDTYLGDTMIGILKKSRK